MRALLPLEPYAVGDAVLAERHARLLPIESKGKVVAYFSPEGQVNYSEFDLGYLASIREALIYGSGAAVVLTLVLGMALGNRLSAAVMRLTTAAQAMTQGELKQRIPVDSRDEVGVLTETFNRMSEALAQSQEQVRSQAVQLKELSVRDSLTGLHDRRIFDEQARSLFERAVRDQRLRGAAQIHRRTPVARNASGSESHHEPGGVR
jgi:methyl-accepting chemotaxis protein